MKTWMKIAAGVGLAAVCVVGLLGVRYWNDNRKANFASRADLFVRPGMSVSDVIAQIPDSCVMRPGSLSRAMSSLKDSDMKPGHYVIEPNKPSVYLPRMLKAGWQTPVKLVLSGTMRQKGAIARKIANQMMMDSTTVAAALDDEDLLSSYGFNPRNVFSLIIPDTYEVWWTDSMKEVLALQKKAYDAFWTDENFVKAEEQGLSPEEVSVLASIVKAESNHEPEYPSIAGVYLNRLHQGMKLQADPTVAFCYDYSLNRILLRHLEVDSPYNTYLHEGLPPGPICVPDKASLKAVLNPDTRNFLFFCASPEMDGTHRFASSMSEHSRNAHEFQRELNKRAAAKKNN